MHCLEVIIKRNEEAVARTEAIRQVLRAIADGRDVTPETLTKAMKELRRL